MSGTFEGGKKTAQKNLAKDPDYYRKIGSRGGKGRAKHDLVVPEEDVYKLSKPSVDPPKVSDGSTYPLLLAGQLWEIVHANYDFVKTPNLEQWADDIEKIHRLDGFDWELIKGVLVWSGQDDFWKQQIRSGKALRRHFEKMLVKIKSDKQFRKPVEI